MKTHQEIRDAIKALQFDDPVVAERRKALDILHALNDRIEALDKLATVNKDAIDATGRCFIDLENRLEEIHPTTT